jgi:hypothetical protein
MSDQPPARWQAEQLPYPRDADYEGAMVGLFDLHNDAEEIIGTLNAGDTFMYLFRRFGYPRFGWDGYKELVQYHITTPMAGVVLTIRPNVTGSYTFGYMLRDDVHQQCEKEAAFPEVLPPKDRPADSIMQQCHTALCAAIRDMLRPVGVRDVLIAICGKVDWDEPDEHILGAVKYAAGAGCGVGNELDKDAEAEQ